MASHGLPFEALVGGRPNSVVVSDGKFRFYILESEAEAEFVATSPTSLVFVVRHPLPKPVRSVCVGACVGVCFITN